jgi:hypothetical protein
MIPSWQEGYQNSKQEQRALGGCVATTPAEEDENWDRIETDEDDRL